MGCPDSKLQGVGQASTGHQSTQVKGAFSLMLLGTSCSDQLLIDWGSLTLLQPYELAGAVLGLRIHPFWDLDYQGQEGQQHKSSGTL